MRAFAALYALAALLIFVPVGAWAGLPAAALFCGSTLVVALGILGLAWWLDRRGY